VGPDRLDRSDDELGAALLAVGVPPAAPTITDGFHGTDSTVYFEY
jgi:hypothetical protein